MTQTDIARAAPQTPAPEAEALAANRPVFRPLADLRETADAVHLAIEMPGVAPDAVEIEVEKRVLTIRGTVAARDPAGWRRIRHEYQDGDYLRVFTLSDGIDADAISAGMRHGVLTLELPRKTPHGPRKIAVAAA